MINSNKGVSAPMALITIIILAIVLVGGFFIYNYYTTPEKETETNGTDTSNIGEQKDNGKEQECTDILDPVCGKDGETYPNKCFAELLEVEIDYNGECETNSPIVKCKNMTIDKAINIANSSECTENAKLSSKAFCNENTDTWWIDLDLFEEKQGCNPACVINVITEEVEINWRCTGAILPEKMP
ncbi:MAG: Kazal-type serine protease inhibitor family protein [Candidatus Nealsonbacteria bacterium]